MTAPVHPEPRKMLRLTPPLRAACIAALVVLLLQMLPQAGALLEYRRILLLPEPWRVLTGHMVHVNWTHALVNAGAWIVLARMFEPIVDTARQLACLAVSAVVVSIALALAFPHVAWYRGASGILHALFFAGATASLSMAWQSRQRGSLLSAAVLLIGGSLKVALELPRDGGLPYAQWLASATVPQAHLVGALVGAAIGLLWALRPPRGPRFSAQGGGRA